MIGPLPTEIGNLSNLRELNLSNNHLTGMIPGELVNLVHIYDPDNEYQFIGLSLDYNWLDVPFPYPSDPPTALKAFLMQKDPDWHLHQAQISKIYIPVSTSVTP